jgi:hypothetical protein
MFEYPETEIIVHVTEMLVQALSTEVEDPQTTVSEPTEDFSERICALAETYYGSEATYKPPNEPTVPGFEVAIFLFQGVTTMTRFEVMKRAIPHSHVLRLLRALVVNLKGMESRQQIPWAKADFSQYMSEMLEVGPEIFLANPRTDMPVIRQMSKRLCIKSLILQQSCNHIRTFYRHLISLKRLYRKKYKLQ